MCFFIDLVTFRTQRTHAHISLSLHSQARTTFHSVTVHSICTVYIRMCTPHVLVHTQKHVLFPVRVRNGAP